MFVATIEKFLHEFHIYRENGKLYCLICNETKKHYLTYDHVYKILYADLREFKKLDGTYILKSRQRVISLDVEEYFIHKLIMNEANYSYLDYMNHRQRIEGKKGVRVKVCAKCGHAIVVGNSNGKAVRGFAKFTEMKKELEQSTDIGKSPFCHSIGRNYYFVKAPFSEDFVCNNCIRERIYKNSSYNVS